MHRAICSGGRSLNAKRRIDGCEIAAYDEPVASPDVGHTGASFIYVVATEGDEVHGAVGVREDV
jgi:hypothetical protein